MLSITTSHSADATTDEPNLTLAPEEIETLTSLMVRYDLVLHEIDVLNGRLQELLDCEGPKKDNHP